MKLFHLMRFTFSSLMLLALAFSCHGQDLQLITFADGFDRPVDIANCGDDRLFILEQFNARIWILDREGNRLPEPFLDLPAVGTQNEQGLLGLAFHPDYQNNGYFFVNYTRTNGDTRVSRFQVSANDPNVADPGSEVVLFEVDQPYANHNGGCLKFGPDGYLYIGLGDGGSGGDPNANGQNTSVRLGKLLRIDVDNGNPYAVPADNPFVNQAGYLPEIWALGMRNPWRFSFDRMTGDLWIGDVGQNNWEEVDFQPAGSTGGENYGWRCYEGNHPFNTSGCGSMSDYVFPVAEYANAGSDCSVTGGFVYRGLNYPNLFGHYLYTDYCSGKIWSLTPDGSGGWNNQLLKDLSNYQYVSFGENKNGELFLTALGSGIIYWITDSELMWEYSSNAQAPSCPGANDGSISLAFNGIAPAMQYLWNTGDTLPEIVNLAGGTYSVTITAPNGATATETFELPESVIQLSGVVTPVTCPGDSDGAIDLTLAGNIEPGAAGWSDGSDEFDRTGLNEGSYSVTVTTDEGCTLTQSFGIGAANDNPTAPVILLQNDTILSVPDTYSAYQWFLNGVEIPGAAGANYVVEVSGLYTVEVANAAGCTSSSDPILVELTATQEVPEGLSEVSLQPNPFSSSLLLELRSEKQMNLEIRLLDLSGQVVNEKSLRVNGFAKLSLDTALLPEGTYVLQLRSERHQWSTMVMKGKQ